MRVDQILCAAGPVDGVTGQALAYRRLLGSWGWGGEDYAPVQAAGMPFGAVRPLNRLRPARADAVIVHYSGYTPGLERLVAGAGRTLLVSHNVTPAQYFWASDPAEAVRCQLGRAQLAELASVADALVGVSEFNAGELRALSGREASVIPVLFDRHGLPGADRAGDPPIPPDPSTPPTVLFVGRLTPHKRQDLVIRAFARWRERESAGRLVLVGTPLSRDFAHALARLADELAPGAVVFESGLSAAQLWERYRGADVFLCLSEHEGFCIPLLEAFHFGVPVIARDAGAVAEVVDDAGVLVDGDDGGATIAELLRIVLGDGELRAELVSRGERRLAQYEYGRVAARLREQLEALCAGRAR
jgi:glycosyltransferase involved in cell wall biosynthesis